MRITVFGATGRTGRPLVARADVARFVFDCLAAESFVHELPKAGLSR